MSCSKDDETQPHKADFTYVITNPRVLPTNVDFTSLSLNASSYEWQFGDGSKIETSQDTISRPYNVEGTYTVMLVAIGVAGRDTAFKNVVITKN